MVGDERMGWPPSVSPPMNWQREDPHWRHFDNSVNAVSFGFVATAILISMFLVMAVFERFIRPPTPAFVASGARGNHHRADLEARGGLEWKLGAAPPSPKMPVYAREVSVLMPGENLPTFIAQPAPAPCPPERVQWHRHQRQRQQISSFSHVPTPTSPINITNAT